MHTCDQQDIAKTAALPFPRDLFTGDMRGLEAPYLNRAKPMEEVNGL